LKSVQAKREKVTDPDDTSGFAPPQAPEPIEPASQPPPKP